MNRRATEQFPALSFRVLVFLYLALLCFSLLVFRLYYLQAINGGYFARMSENNRRRAVRMSPPRGDIYDREGKVLVRNRPAFDLALIREDIEDWDGTIAEISKISGISEGSLKKNLKRSSRNQPFVPKVIIPDLGHDLLARIKAQSYRLPGVIVQAVPARIYPHQKLAAQVLGYVREITALQIEAKRDARYKSGDLIGQSGVEQQFEEYLRGEPGYKQIEVDARGNPRGELSLIDTKKGHDIYLTIDLQMQERAESALGDFSGAVVAVEAKTGEVLTLASTPQFDANVFSGAMKVEDWRKIANDPERPLKNRAISNHYPPGSTVKLFLAAAALSAGVIKPESKLYCPGYYKFAGRRYHCHQRRGHGQVDMARAIRVSCNAYYYQLGQLLKIEGIHKFAALFGFGKKTGIDLPAEESAINPSPPWKKERYAERWYPGDTLPVSIGQGYFVVTPMQHAFALAALVNGGKLYKPKLLKKVAYTHEPCDTPECRAADMSYEQVFPSQLVREIPIDKKILKTVSEFAEGVVQHKEGTGHKAAFDKIRVGGKTGTAQVRSLRFGQKEKKFRDHAWFVGFAPAEDPQVVVSVIVENGGHGGAAAAPVARDVMEVYLRKKGYDVSSNKESGK